MSVHASLFTGIGGFDLAAEQVGWRNSFAVERDEFCQKVIRKRFPKTTIYGDIKETDFSRWRGAVDVLSGGFPCQPFSTAGKRQGEDDDRFLWPEMLRAIREIQPPWIVGENVAGILSMEDGGTLDRILADLEGEGYAVQTFLIPASAAGGVHKRERVWIVAYNESLRRNGKQAPEAGKHQGREQARGLYSNASDAIRHDGREVQVEGREPGLRQKSIKHGPARPASNSNPSGTQKRYPSCVSGRPRQLGWLGDPRELLRTTVSPVRRADDGLPPELDRRKRLHALGNAIVWQVAYQIFASIDAIIKGYPHVPEHHEPAHQFGGVSGSGIRCAVMETSPPICFETRTISAKMVLRGLSLSTRRTTSPARRKTPNAGKTFAVTCSCTNHSREK